MKRVTFSETHCSREMLFVVHIYWLCCDCTGPTQPVLQPSSVGGTSGIVGMQSGTVGNPTVMMGTANPSMMAVQSGVAVNSSPMMAMQPGVMGMPRHPNMYGMQPAMMAVPQQQMMMGMQAGVMGIPNQQSAMGVQPSMMPSGLMPNQQKTSLSFDEL